MSTFFAPERFVTPDFTLRGYLPGDGEKFANAIANSYDHLSPFMPTVFLKQSVEECETRVRQAHASYLKQEGFTLGIFAPDESELYGHCGYYLREGPLAFGNAEIGMWIRASQAGKGLGTNVLKALIQWGFTEWQWTRLGWKCAVENLPSRRTAERAGLTLEATLRQYLPNFRDEGKSDTHYYSIVKSEWEKAREVL
jgi:ribosomal-protein-serine acetyltransferase